MKITKVLFVCTGNICRSPTAEGVMLHKVKALGMEQHFEIDSVGTTAYHTGERLTHAPPSMHSSEVITWRPYAPGK